MSISYNSRVRLRQDPSWVGTVKDMAPGVMMFSRNNWWYVDWDDQDNAGPPWPEQSLVLIGHLELLAECAE